jgi:V/A-type H+/Na+-transporting ATPase subunit D
MSERIAATKGTLQKAREQLKFIERGKDVLKMKRDQLAGELNKLLGQMEERKVVNKLFDDAFGFARYAYSVMGVDSFVSAVSSVDTMEVRALPTSVVGVIMPEVEIIRKPARDQISSPTMMKAAEKLEKAVQEAVKLGVTEAKIEQLARELMDTNRKVNALEKVVIPRYKATIRYIEDRLNEEALQEYFITKRMRDIGRVAKERSSI